MKATRSPLWRQLMKTEIGTKKLKEFLLNGETVKPVKGCFNCKHDSLGRHEYPCEGCNFKYNQWQPE